MLLWLVFFVNKKSNLREIKMSSFLKQAYALEQEVVEEVTEVDGDELIETVEETEVARQESESLGAEVERAIAVHDEIENQNDTLEEIIEQQGEVTPEVAAVVEVARRTAAAGLGLNPDEEGEELVDAAGLESMVATKSVVALEDAKETARKLWEKIKALWEAFVKRASDFWNWLVKLVRFTDKKYKQAIAVVKAVSDEDFAKALEKLQAEDGKVANLAQSARAALQANGKLVDVNRQVGPSIAKAEAIRNNVDGAIKKLYAEDLAKAKGAEVFKANVKTDEVVVLNEKIKVSAESGQVVCTSETDMQKVPASFAFTRKELMDALQIGTGVVKNLDKFANESFKRYTKVKDEFKNAEDIKKLPEAEAKVYNANVKAVLAARRAIYTMEQKVVKKHNEILKAYLKIASAVAPVRAQAEETAAK